MPEEWVQALWVILGEIPFSRQGAAIPAQPRAGSGEAAVSGRISVTAEVCTYPSELQATRISF